MNQQQPAFWKSTKHRMVAGAVLVLVTAIVFAGSWLTATGLAESDLEVSSSVQDFPKPDFTALEKHFEVIKYEYDFTTNVPKLNVVVKKKGALAPKWWLCKWTDGDGVVLTKSSLLLDPPSDEPIRETCYAPWKREMPKVKTALVYENPDK